MLATVARAAADDTFAYQGLLFRVISEEDHTVEVVLRLKPVDNLSIPSFAMNDTLRYSVTGIGYMAFFNCADLTSVSIPNSVTIIRDFAFQWYTGMTSVFPIRSPKSESLHSRSAEALLRSPSPIRSLKSEGLLSIAAVVLLR